MATIPATRDEGSAPFFDGAAEGRLLVKQCSCGAFAGPERIMCGECGNQALEWVDASGNATLVSWIVTHAKAAPDQAGDTNVVGLVELEEGPWMYATLLDTDEVELGEGTPLVVDFIRPGGGEAIPAFRPR